MLTLSSLPPTYTIVLSVACFFGISVYAFSLLFAAVIMPGLDAFQDDTDYLRAFQVIDGRIQNNEPMFIFTWVGSMIASIALAVMTIRLPAAKETRFVMVVSCVVFLVGHVITVTQNIPRNNRLHDLDLDQTDDATLADMRQEFTGPWCAWNTARTALFGLVSLFWLITLALSDAPTQTKESFENPPEVEARFRQVV